MKASNFDLKSYFQRIGHLGAAEANAATLSALMRAQLFSIPFENVDVQAGKGISMIPEDIVEKLLHQGRGGYCYEVNGLFAMALGALGIPYRFVAARPMFYPVRRPRTHMAIVAEIDRVRWLCDLGFGSYGIRAPIDIDQIGVDVQQDHDTFRLIRGENDEYVLMALVQGGWTHQFGFDLSPQEWIDFTPANHLNSTHPGAIFVQKLLVIRHRPDGRSILLGTTLKSVTAGVVTERSVAADEIPTVLRQEFGLDVGRAGAADGGTPS